MAQEEAKNKKQLPPTVREYRKWRKAHFALKAVEYVAPFGAFGTMLGIYWNEWFPGDGSEGSVGIGLVLAIASLAISVLAMTKKDSELMKKIGVFIPIAFAFLAWGLVCVLLGNIATTFGKTMMATGAGLIATAASDSVDKAAVYEKYATYRKLADENGLTKQGEWKQNAQAQAEYDGKKKKETVRYVPHD